MHWWFMEEYPSIIYKINQLTKNSTVWTIKPKLYKEITDGITTMLLDTSWQYSFNSKTRKSQGNAHYYWWRLCGQLAKCLKRTILKIYQTSNILHYITLARQGNIIFCQMKSLHLFSRKKCIIFNCWLFDVDHVYQVY